jgi:hypothetical protein
MSAANTFIQPHVSRIRLQDLKERFAGFKTTVTRYSHDKMIFYGHFVIADNEGGYGTFSLVRSGSATDRNEWRGKGPPLETT